MSDETARPTWSAWDSAGTAFRTVFGHPRILVAQIGIWTLLLIAAAIGVEFGLKPINRPVINPVTTLFAVPIAIGWHRRILLGEVRTGWSSLYLSWPHLSYLVLIALLALFNIHPFAYLYAFTLFKTSGVAYLALFAIFLVVWYVTLRLCPILPLIAIRQPNAWRLGWRFSRGNVWRLLGMLLLIGIPYHVVFILAFYAMGGDYNRGSQAFIEELSYTVLFALMVSTFAVAMSHAVRPSLLDSDYEAARSTSFAS